MKLTLPTVARPRVEKPPSSVRVLLAGSAKSGKSTLAAGFLPKSTLIIDTQHGTDLLPGEHFVQHVAAWDEFVEVVNLLVRGNHDYETVVLDLVNDLWRFCDFHHAGKNGITAAATDDYQKAVRTARADFQQTIGKLVASPLGIWMLTHTREVPEKATTRHKVSLPDKEVHEYIVGVVEYVWVVERDKLAPSLMTEPSARFEAGGRTPVPDGMACDPRQLWIELDKGLNPSKYDENGNPIKQKVAA